MKAYANNKAVRHNYHIRETYTAGISLEGGEVKSVRNGQISLKESYIRVKDNQAFLVQAHIAKPGYLDGFTKFNETRDRRLLLTKKELKQLQKAVQEPGKTVMALQIFQPDDAKKIKIQIAVCEGKQLFDKRNDLKTKAQEMDTKRALKDY